MYPHPLACGGGACGWLASLTLWRHHQRGGQQAGGSAQGVGAASAERLAELEAQLQGFKAKRKAKVAELKAEHTQAMAALRVTHSSSCVMHPPSTPPPSPHFG
jgi:hypothetical protein